MVPAWLSSTCSSCATGLNNVLNSPAARRIDKTVTYVAATASGLSTGAFATATTARIGPDMARRFISGILENAAGLRPYVDVSGILDSASTVVDNVMPEWSKTAKLVGATVITGFVTYKVAKSAWNTPAKPTMRLASPRVKTQ
jgi:hypothetical protein